MQPYEIGDLPHHDEQPASPWGDVAQPAVESDPVAGPDGHDATAIDDLH